MKKPLLSSLLRRGNIAMYILTGFVGFIGTMSILFCWSAIGPFPKMIATLTFLTGIFMGVGFGWIGINMSIQAYERRYCKKHKKI